MAEAKALEFRAKHRYARMTARKARPVLNMIRGLDVNRAIEMLDFENRRAAHATRKVLRSALANAEAMIGSQKPLVRAACPTNDQVRQTRISFIRLKGRFRDIDA